MKHTLGWLKDYTDFRDYTPDHENVKEVLQKIKSNPLKNRNNLPGDVDLRVWCSPIENQLNLGSCTANAGVGLIEYFENRAFGKHLNASRLFLYKVTRNFMQETGDNGAYLRSTMGAMALFGTPPEKYWPYIVDDFEVEPTAFCYSFARNYQSIKYYRLDDFNSNPNQTLNRIKSFLRAGFPSMFGFSVYSSIAQANDDGKIPYPAPRGDGFEGGHAVVAVGYDDKMKIKNSIRGSKATTGAFLIRNSWGIDWGDSGYGWLPYDYLLQGRLASDWWSLIKNEYVATDGFDD